jgi:RNA polymerase sigma factor for flagellar operon FliA
MISPSTTAAESLSHARSREQLILEHLPQVRLIAKRIHRNLPPSVSLEDLVSAGTVGLIAAVNRYDASHGVKLKTYAEYKIRGAILDSLRTLDWVSSPATPPGADHRSSDFRSGK